MNAPAFAKSSSNNQTVSNGQTIDAGGSRCDHGASCGELCGARDGKEKAMTFLAGQAPVAQICNLSVGG
jgi:hypothetical protein